MSIPRVLVTGAGCAGKTMLAITLNEWAGRRAYIAYEDFQSHKKRYVPDVVVVCSRCKKNTTTTIDGGVAPTLYVRTFADDDDDTDDNNMFSVDSRDMFSVEPLHQAILDILSAKAILSRSWGLGLKSFVLSLCVFSWLYALLSCLPIMWPRDGNALTQSMMCGNSMWALSLIDDGVLDSMRSIDAYVTHALDSEVFDREERLIVVREMLRHGVVHNVSALPPWLARVYESDFLPRYVEGQRFRDD